MSDFKTDIGKYILNDNFFLIDWPRGGLKKNTLSIYISYLKSLMRTKTNVLSLYIRSFRQHKLITWGRPNSRRKIILCLKLNIHSSHSLQSKTSL